MKRAIAILALAVVGASGCARDRDADDYRREKLAEELAKIGQVAGTYRGVAISKRDGQPLAALSLDLRAGTRVGGRKDGFEAEELPALLGKVIFEDNEHPAETQFKDAFYDSDTGAFRATVMIPVGSNTASGEGKSIELNLQGVIRGASLSGTIEADGYPDSGGEFKLVRGGARPDPALLKREDSKTGLDPLKVRDFVGDGHFWSGVVRRNSLSLDSSSARTEQRFVNLLTPVKTIQVSIGYLEGEITRDHVFFPEAEWNERFGSLLAKVKTSGVEGSLSLQCLWSASRAEFSCRLSGTRHDPVATFIFRPRNSDEGGRK